MTYKTGIGLRQEHWRDMMSQRPAAGFLEIHAENFLGAQGQDILDDLRRDYPFSVHAVGLSLASDIDADHLNRVAALVDRLQPALVSDHLCWTSLDGVYFNDLMPFPHTDEALDVVAANVQRVQDKLKRQLLVENLSAYMQFTDSAMSETRFLAKLAERTGCGILCDVNNLHVNAVNHKGDAAAWLAEIPAAAVGEIHLAGYTVNKLERGEILIDTHGARVDDAVWALYAEAVRRFPQAPALVEWDTDIPAIDVLIEEARKADDIRERALHAKAA
jgi:uncharacterized protein (UPF0276 family)